MKTVSQHVGDILARTPFLAEILSEGLGNTTAIARSIRKDVERRTLEKVSIESIAMALRRMPELQKHPHFGFRYLRLIREISLRSDLTLFFVHSRENLLEKLAAYEKKFPHTILSVTNSLAETLVVSRSDAGKALEKIFGESLVRSQKHVTAITMRLPDESMPVPGVYYPILKALAWEGINVVEIVSAGTEFTIFVENKSVENALSTIRTLTGGQH